MKIVCQCPDCKALKFRVIDSHEIIWQLIGEDEQIALDVILSSPSLQVITGSIKLETELCPLCFQKACN